MAKTAAKATVDDMALALVDDSGPLTLRETLTLLRTPGAPLELDPEEISRQILERKLAATSLDELLNEREGLSAQNILGQPFTAHDFTLVRSSMSATGGFFALISAEMNGKDVQISCGAQAVVEDLTIMKFRGWLPAKVTISRAKKPTGSGYYPLHLRPADTDDEPF